MLSFLRRRTQSEHERITALLSAYVDGELTAQEQQQVDAHVAHCNACAQDLRTLQYTKTLLAEAPMPSIPRSLVVRRADLEAPAHTVARRPFGLSAKLAYGYLKGATALVTVAFALVVASDLIVQQGVGRRGLSAPGPSQEMAVVQKESAVQAVEGEGPDEAFETEAIVVTSVPEVESPVEKAAPSKVTPTPSTRSVDGTPSPPGLDEQQEVEALGVSEAASTETATPEGYRALADETLTPSPIPTAVPTPSPLPPPTPTSPPLATPEPTIALGLAESAQGLGTVRVVEIGLGALALILLVLTVVIRRQQA